MGSQPPPQAVRKLVNSRFRELVAPSCYPLDIQETILMEEDRCAARTYRAGDLMAMWMIGVGLLQFYRSDGELLLTIDLLEWGGPPDAAA